MRVWLVFVAVGMLVLLGCGGTTKIAYISTGDAIYVVDSDGSSQRRVVVDSQLQSLPCWSNDNMRIASVSTDHSAKPRKHNLVISSIDSDEKTVIDLGIIPEVAEANSMVGLSPACWHPQNDSILVEVIQFLVPSATRNLYELSIEEGVGRFDGLPFRLVLSNVESAMWSPNGDKLLFHRESPKFGKYMVQIANAEDGTIIMEDINPGICTSWSAKTQKLLCFNGDALEEEGTSFIFTVNLDGTELTRIRLSQLGEEEIIVFPNWSPNGEKFLFSTIKELSDGRTECRMYTAKIDGTEQSKLLDREDACLGIYSNP